MSKTKIKHPNSLAEYRHRMGFTQEQVTKLLGYKRRHAMWILETGQSVPSLTAVLKLAATGPLPRGRTKGDCGSKRTSETYHRCRTLYQNASR
jgi:DNA-binding XRE family transcriptional regulator